KIKSITSKNCTQNRTSEHTLITREHAPLPLIQTMEHASLTHIQTREHASLTLIQTMEHAPLPLIQTMEHAPLPLIQTREHAPLPLIQTREHASLTLIQTREHAPLPDTIAMEHNSVTMEHAPLPDTKKQTPLWTQKFGCKEITNEEHLFTAIDYIKHNRSKHNLPQHSNKGFKPLVESIICSYEHAFRQEYKGGFDVVIGNPPYVRQELFKEIKPYLEKNYKCYNSIADLYTYFIEKGINLINNGGLFSFILPNKFLKASYGKEIRNVIKQKSNLELLFDFDDYPVFDDATTYPIIFVLNKNKNYTKDYFIYSEINKKLTSKDPLNLLIKKSVRVDYTSMEDDNWQFQNSNNSNLLSKLKNNSTTLKEIVNNKIFRGVSTGKNEVFIIDKITADNLINEKNKSFIRKIVTGKEVKRNNLSFDNLYLLYIPWEYDLEYDENIKNYLLENKELLSNRPEVKEGRFNWWCLSRYGSKNAEYLFKPKIIYPRINNQCNFYFDSTGEYSLSDNNFFISTAVKHLLPILNSKLTYYYLKSIASTLQGGYLDFRRPYIETIPIKTPVDIAKFEEIANILIKKNTEFKETSQKFQRALEREFFDKGFKPLANAANSLPKKLQDWYLLSYGDFIRELEKKKVKLSLSQKAAWEDYFLQESKKALALKTTIDNTDIEIDAMVYALYGLSEEEIEIVENS
ncbi:MAG: Eco57I restriction-modification methylase domain-containing protein, partial [Lutibacter sp.]|nr:Eco57I restriction-modification methylase domain-containing protein [Lutibacter sp.]